MLILDMTINGLMMNLGPEEVGYLSLGHGPLLRLRSVSSDVSHLEMTFNNLNFTQ